MRYLLIAVPMSIYSEACKVAQALDNDTGGDKNFAIHRATKDGVTYAIAHSLASDKMPDYLQAFLACPAEYLHDSVGLEYANRFPDLIVPTIEECQAFIDNAVIVADMGLDAGLESLGLVRKILKEKV